MRIVRRFSFFSVTHFNFNRFFEQSFINHGLEFICCYILITCDGATVYTESVYVFRVAG